MTATPATAPALPEHPDFRRTVTVYRHGWTGETRTATYEGRCILCGVRTYGHDDGQDDPRGPLGDHAAAALDPADYGAIGRIVPACFLCGNDTEERYRRLLNRARRLGRWHTPEPASTECYCGAPAELVPDPGNQYRGWRHAGPAPVRAWITPDHTADPRPRADVGCSVRVHHFSGSWCPTCGGWA